MPLCQLLGEAVAALLINLHLQIPHRMLSTEVDFSLALSHVRLKRPKKLANCLLDDGWCRWKSIYIDYKYGPKKIRHCGLSRGAGDRSNVFPGLANDAELTWELAGPSCRGIGDSNHCSTQLYS